MSPVLNGEMPVIVDANELRQIQDAITWAEEEGVRVVIRGGRDAHYVADHLAAKQIPVMISAVLDSPSRQWEPYDSEYRLPAKLHEAGVPFAIVGGAIPSKFIPAVDKGIQEAAVRGVLAGYPLVDFQVELFDGSYHSVDSSEQAFKMAGILGFNAVARKCKPILLEPVMEIKITTPDRYLGDVLGTISGRRGHILGTDAGADGGTRVRAQMPEAELHAFITEIHALTHGHGSFTQKFHGYEQVPADVAQRVIAESQAAKAASA
jgi:translation elongation factor EF-G